MLKIVSRAGGSPVKTGKPSVKVCVRSAWRPFAGRTARALAGSAAQLVGRFMCEAEAVQAPGAELAAEEELASLRPDLDGTQIMAILGIGPGREVGEAYRFLLELRIEEGPLGPERAAEAQVVEHPRLVFPYDVRRRKLRECLPALGRRERGRRVVPYRRGDEEPVPPINLLLGVEA